MTTLSEDLADYLADVTGFRWYPLRLPRGEETSGGDMLAGTYQRISGIPAATTHSGGTDLQFSRYQLTIYTESYKRGYDAARALASAMNGTTPAGLDASAILMDDGEDVDPEPRGLFRQRLDVRFGSKRL